MIVTLTVLQIACSSLASKPEITRDTALFVYENGPLVLKQHGDTVWSKSGKRIIIIVDNGRRITIVRKEGTDSSTSEWCVRGDLAIRADGSIPQSVPVSQLRLIKGVVEQARRGQAILNRIP